MKNKGLSGGQDPILPVQGARAQTLVRELDPTRLGQPNKQINIFLKKATWDLLLNSMLNSPLLKPLHEYACTLNLKIP